MNTSSKKYKKSEKSELFHLDKESCSVYTMYHKQYFSVKNSTKRKGEI